MTTIEQAVSPRLVRRIHSSDVFVTGLRETGPDMFQVGVRLPAAHPFYGPVGRHTHDPLLLLECLRESGLLVTQAAYEIPREFKIVVHHKTFSVNPAGLRTCGAEPVDILINISARDIRRRGKGLAGMCFEFGCLRDGQLIGSGAYRWSCVTPGAYRKLRGGYQDALPAAPSGCVPVRPALVGRRAEIDVMLAETHDDIGWTLRVDPGHPVVFDHPMDHVPGNGLIEAVRQAALLVVGQPDALPIGGEISFQNYVEFDRPTMVYAGKRQTHADSRTATVGVVLIQAGRTAMTGNLDLLVSNVVR